MADKLVTIAEFADSIQADLAKQLLTDRGRYRVISGRTKCIKHLMRDTCYSNYTTAGTPKQRQTGLGNPGIRQRTGAIVG